MFCTISAMIEHDVQSSRHWEMFLMRICDSHLGWETSTCLFAVSEQTIPAHGWRIGGGCVRIHNLHQSILEFLSFNTSYMEQFKIKYMYYQYLKSCTMIYCLYTSSPIMCFAARLANTKLSSKLLLAKRFFPCTPLQLVSPTAYRWGIVVSEYLSTWIPPMK